MTNVGANIIGFGNKDKRRELDFYPTPKEVTFALLEFLRLPKITILEPCCGSGDISEILKLYGHNVISSDLRFTGYGKGGVDYLKTRFLNLDAIITNPPFNIADEIIIKSLTESNIVCMLLKSQYWHAKKRISLFNNYKPAYILPLTWRPDFTGGGSSMMDVAWTVWIKNQTPTIFQPLAKPDINFLF